MRIVFWGTPEYSVKSLRNLNNSKHEVVAVISQPDKKRSRGNKLKPSPVKQYALNEELKIFTPDTIKDNIQFIDQLKELNCDVFIVIAYGKILPKEILDIPKYYSWNAHASLLPRWRGAAPIQWSILSGDEFTGVGIMKMEEGLDTGDVLVEKKIEIEIKDNLKTLTDKLSELSSELILESLEILDGGENYYLKKQKDLNRTIKYARMLEKKDYEVKWDNESVDIYRKINALYPRAYITYKGKNLKIIKIKILDKHDVKHYKIDDKFTNKTDHGIVIALIENEGIIISTKSNPILLLEAKIEGKNISSKNQLIQQLKPVIGNQF